MYIDFFLYMNFGILVICADDIEFYSVGEFEFIRFDKFGFIVLVYFFSLIIGIIYGVFVLEFCNYLEYGDFEYRCCYCFFYKFSIEKMY